MTLDDIKNQISVIIGRQETASGTAGVGLSLNNPGAIKYASWESAYGATPTPSGFASFPSLESGTGALQALVAKYISGGASLSSLINSWAPPSDNNTNNAARVNQLAAQTGLDPTQGIAAQTTGSASLSPIGTAIQAIGAATGSSTLQSIGQTTAGVSDATNATLGSLSWGRVAAGVLGVVFVIVGLSLLRSPIQIVQSAANTAGKATGLVRVGRRARGAAKTGAKAAAGASVASAAEDAAAVAAV